MSPTHDGHIEEPHSSGRTGSEPKTPAATARSKPPARLVKLTSPLVRQLAGRRWFPVWAVLSHHGRRTGRDYAIPVAVLVTADTFVIALPWGPKTNWAQNVLAAKGCGLRWKGVDYQVTNPELVGTDVALRAAGRLQRAMIKRLNFPAFIQLHR